MDEEQYIEPSKKPQALLLGFLALVALMIVTLEPGMTGVLVVTAIVAFLVSMFWSTYFARLGYRALKLGSFPPPGTVVVRRTIIRTGKRAILEGYFALAFAGLMSVFAILAAYAAWLFASAL